MVLVYEDGGFGKLRKSSQWFATTFGIVREDLGWIPKGPNSAHFEQKAWANMVLKMAEFG